MVFITVRHIGHPEIFRMFGTVKTAA